VARRNLVPLLLFLASASAVALMWWAFAATERTRYAATSAVRQSRSDIALGMQIHHAAGPIVDEFYRLRDLDGVSTSEYRAVGRSGLTVKVDALPRQTVDVAFFFDRSVADGIWELPNRPVRGDASLRYTIDVYQLTDGKHGQHRFTFTDPHYWATTGGHQYHIHLAKNKPVPNLLQMTSNVTVEPRYQRLVDDFAQFGSAQFRAKVVAARAKVAASGGGSG
jgi:hypothetical protein